MNAGLFRVNDGVFSDQILGARERQEDVAIHRSFNDGKSLLVVLADGMGGHQGGEVASRAIVDAFTSAFFNEFLQIKTPFRLFGSLERANQNLEEIGKKNTELEGMGSTLVAAVVSPEGVSWISVGDSLLLRVRDGKVQRINEDHSMAPLLDAAVKKGTLTSEEAAAHRDRNALRSAVSGAPIDLIDVTNEPEPLRRGDVLILASDGLLTLTDKEIAVLVSAQKSAGARAIVNKLLGAVSDKNKRRQDNTTIAAVLIESSSSSDVRSRETSSSSLALGVGAVVISLLVGLGLGSGFLSGKSSFEFFSTVADKVRTFEIPKRSGEALGSTVPQPVDIPDSATRNEDDSPKAPAAKPSEPDLRGRRNEVGGEDATPSSSSEKSGSKKSKPVGEDDASARPPLGGEKVSNDVLSTGETQKPTQPQEESTPKKEQPVETAKSPSGDQVSNIAEASQESKAAESNSIVPTIPQSKPSDTAPGNHTVTPSSSPVIRPQQQRDAKKND